MDGQSSVLTLLGKSYHNVINVLVIMTYIIIFHRDGMKVEAVVLSLLIFDYTIKLH